MCSSDLKQILTDTQFKNDILGQSPKKYDKAAPRIGRTGRRRAMATTTTTEAAKATRPAKAKAKAKARALVEAKALARRSRTTSGASGPKTMATTTTHLGRTTMAGRKMDGTRRPTSGTTGTTTPRAASMVIAGRDSTATPLRRKPTSLDRNGGREMKTAVTHNPAHRQPLELASTRTERLTMTTGPCIPPPVRAKPSPNVTPFHAGGHLNQECFTR